MTIKNNKLEWCGNWLILEEWSYNNGEWYFTISGMKNNLKYIEQLSSEPNVHVTIATI